MARLAAGVSPAGAVHGSGSARLLLVPAGACETLMRIGPRTISNVGESAAATGSCFARGEPEAPARLAASGTAANVKVFVRGEKWPLLDGVTAEPAEPPRGEGAPEAEVDRGRADTGSEGAAPAEAARGDTAPEVALRSGAEVGDETAAAAAGGGGGRENSAA
jgi:hypothetical protein